MMVHLILAITLIHIAVVIYHINVTENPAELSDLSDKVVNVFQS